MINESYINQFNERGFFKISNTNISSTVKELSNNILSLIKGSDIDCKNLSDLHKFIKPVDLNQIRLRIITHLNKEQSHKNQIADNLWPYIKELLGPNCMIQRNMNLVIHMPDDDLSVIPSHSDVLTGNSPFELALWIPLTKCYGTNSMYIKNMIDKEFIHCDVGDAILFDHSKMHGNCLNKEKDTRVSLNFRVRPLFAPCSNKDTEYYFTSYKISEFTKRALERIS